MKNPLSLAELQTKLLGLIKNSYQPTQSDDPYLHEVAISPNLKLIREIALWWRQNHVMRYCFFTAGFLKATNQMEAATARYFQSNNHSSFIEEIGPHFLKWLITQETGILSVIARFELGMMAVTNGECYQDTIMWPCDPFLVMHGLIQGDLPQQLTGDTFHQMIISDKITGGFEVIPIPPYL